MTTDNLWLGMDSSEYLKRLKEADRDDPAALRKQFLQEWPVDPERGSGRTSEQVMRLPLGSTFVVLNSSCVGYTRALLHHLGRSDIVLYTYEGFKAGLLSLIHRIHQGFDVDHAVWEALEGRHHAYRELAEAERHIHDKLHERKQNGKGQAPRPHRT